jgi:hypothetical protein
MTEIVMLPGRSFQVAGVLALSGIVAAMISGSRGPAPAAPAPVVTKAVFAERFDAPNEWPLLKKTDRLPLPVVKPPEPAPVPAPVPVLVTENDEPVEQIAQPVAHRHHHHVVEHAEHEHESNICTRHHLRKVITRGGRSWRCRR